MSPTCLQVTLRASQFLLLVALGFLLGPNTPAAHFAAGESYPLKALRRAAELAAVVK
jgi:hypothetical protein